MWRQGAHVTESAGPCLQTMLRITRLGKIWRCVLRHVAGFFLACCCVFAAARAEATFSLGLNCGEIHFAAFNPCDKCGFQVDMSKDASLAMLALQFTDHYMTPKSLREFGAVIKAIKPACSDGNERLWVFLQYVYNNHPGILERIRVPPPYDKTVPGILSRLKLPVFTVERARR